MKQISQVMKKVSNPKVLMVLTLSLLILLVVEGFAWLPAQRWFFGHGSVATAQEDNEDKSAGRVRVDNLAKSLNIAAVLEKRELFEQNTQPISGFEDLSNALSDGVVFNLNKPAVNEILNAKPEYLILPVPNGKGGAIELELTKVNIFATGFKVTTSGDTNENVEEGYGIHYRGIVKGTLNSFASISIFRDEVMGIFSTDEIGNMVLGRLGGNNPTNRHILYNDRNLKARLNQFCDVKTPVGETLPAWPSPQLQSREAATSHCVRIYVEANYNLFLNKGTVANTVSYITGLFNQSAALIANAGVSTTLSEVFVWNSPSPYTGSNSDAQLQTFRATRTSFNGNLAHLVDLSSNGLGGIAYLDVLCLPSFSYGL